jgi:predicted nucleic acid-binding protein
VIVVDASVVAPAIADDGDDGDRVRARLHGERLVAPALVDLEVTSVLRRAALGGRLDLRRAAQALADLRALPLARAAHLPLLDRIWELRDNVTAYAGAYVALAEAVRAPLITADGRLAGAPGLRCAIEVLA